MIPLPIDSVLPELIAALGRSRAAVLVAPPGAGKTTRVPPALLAANLLWEQHPHLIMLQPRRVAARAAATRIAEENNWELGREVGYQVRFERVYSPQTRLHVITEGILTRRLLDDPFLDGVGAVLLDEFHERSINTDLAIALLREVRDSVRDDLILLVMSATLHAEPVAKFLGNCPIIRSPGKLFDVEIEYRPPSSLPIADRVAGEIKNILSLAPSSSGDILTFLPGAGEIRWTQERLGGIADLILPLHGSLPFEQQMQALKPANRRKVILATNIAETSLTIPGVRTVIDSGLARVAAYDGRRGLDQLTLQSISRASADQRAGRAGRTAPGRCIRLWTAKEHAALSPFDLAEIQRVDLAATMLALHAWGKHDAGQFNWYESPPEKSLRAAERLLWMLVALTAETTGNITPLGRRMLELPVHPRLARLLIAADDEGLPAQGAALAALLSERDSATDFSAQATQGPSDLLIRLARPPSRDTTRLTENLQRLLRRASPKSPHRILPSNDRANKPDESALLKLALLAYPDRVARRRGRDPSSAVMVGGAGIRLGRESVVRSAEFFIAVEVQQDDRAARGEALVRIASAVDPAWLAECFPGSVTRKQTAVFNEERGRVMGLTQIAYLDLILSEEPDAAIEPAVAGDVLARALMSRVAEIFAADESSASLLARVEFLRQFMPEHPWPVFDAPLLARVLTEACAGKRSLDDLKRHPLATFLRNHLIYPLDRLLDQHAPSSLQVPSGKNVHLRYEKGKPPVLAARLQELFGWTQTPRLAAGRAAVVLELLGPNFRPVQVTDDLASFWANTYFQVRKDLRRRYPKHSWPDDPVTAPPHNKR